MKQSEIQEAKIWVLEQDKEQQKSESWITDTKEGMFFQKKKWPISVETLAQTI